jgi:hypothetical protein
LRSVVIFLGLTSFLTAQPHFDLILKGGHVIDPKNAINRVTDVAIANGRIARIAENIPESEAQSVINVKGLYQEFPQISGASQASSSSNCRLGGGFCSGLGVVCERIFLIPSASA